MKPLPTIATLAFSIAAALGSTSAIAAAPYCSKLTEAHFQTLREEGGLSCLYSARIVNDQIIDREDGESYLTEHFLWLSPESTPEVLISYNGSYVTTKRDREGVVSIIFTHTEIWYERIELDGWNQRDLLDVVSVIDWWFPSITTTYGTPGETFPNLSITLADLFGANNSVLFNPEGANMGATAPTANYSPAYSPAYPTAFSNSSPVPEPETWAMLLAGLGIVGAIARKRRPRTM